MGLTPSGGARYEPQKVQYYNSTMILKRGQVGGGRDNVTVENGQRGTVVNYE